MKMCVKLPSLSVMSHIFMPIISSIYVDVIGCHMSY